MAVPATAFDDRVDHGASPAGLGVADEEPVFLAQGGRADGVFDQVVVDLDRFIKTLFIRRCIV